MVSAPSLSDLLSSYRADRSKSVTLPMPSQRGHMPPRRVKVAFSAWVRPAPRSTVMAPLAVTEGTLTEYALGGPMCGCPSRLNRIRSMALASVTVPTVERALAPIRSWSTMIAVVSPSSTSTSGRASVGMKPCTKALYVSLISRCDSCAMVLNTSELLPEPETPVNTVSRRLGSSTLTSLRWFTRAPCTRIGSWRSATGSALLIGSPSVPVLTRLLVCHHPVDLEVHPGRGVAVGAALPGAATAPRLGLDGDRHRGARHVRADDRGPYLAVDPVHQPALGPLQLGGVPAGRAELPGVEPAARVAAGLPVVHAPLVGQVAGEVVGEGLVPAGQVAAGHGHPRGAGGRRGPGRRRGGRAGPVGRRDRFAAGVVAGGRHRRRSGLRGGHRPDDDLEHHPEQAQDEQRRGHGSDHRPDRPACGLGRILAPRGGHPAGRSGGPRAGG